MSRFSVPVEHFASVVGAVVASYNLPGRSSELRLTPEILAGVYLGQVTRGTTTYWRAQIPECRFR